MDKERRIYMVPSIKMLGLETETDIAVSLPIDGGETPIDPGNAESPGFPKGSNVWDDNLE